jgi:hypothetical protein
MSPLIRSEEDEMVTFDTINQDLSNSKMIQQPA